MQTRERVVSIIAAMALIIFGGFVLRATGRVKAARRRRRESLEQLHRDGMICIRCGYNMRASPKKCSECGYEP